MLKITSCLAVIGLGLGWPAPPAAMAGGATVAPTGEYARIDVHLIDETMRVLSNGAPGEKQTATARIQAHPEDYAPPVLYLLSNVLFRAGNRDDGMFWYHAGQLRARFDANRCADISARQAVGVLNQTYGPMISKYSFQDPPRLEKLVLRVVEWDRKTPRRYDHRWINLHGMGAVQSGLGAQDTRSKPPVLSLPTAQWDAIAQQTRADYLKGLREAMSQLKSRKIEVDPCDADQEKFCPGPPSTWVSCINEHKHEFSQACKDSTLTRVTGITSMQEMISSCFSDGNKFCPRVSPSNWKPCLLKHKDALSAGCKDTVAPRPRTGTPRGTERKSPARSSFPGPGAGTVAMNASQGGLSATVMRLKSDRKYRYVDIQTFALGFRTYLGSDIATLGMIFNGRAEGASVFCMLGNSYGTGAQVPVSFAGLSEDRKNELMRIQFPPHIIILKGRVKAGPPLLAPLSPVFSHHFDVSDFSDLGQAPFSGGKSVSDILEGR